jgi:hypothetical protein
MSDYAALHARMEAQRAERKATGRPLQTGDLVQAEVGGEIVEIHEHESAGDYVGRMAMQRPAFNTEGSTAGLCALYGGKNNWTGKGSAKE